ncbi:MAG: TlpA disulfide reductase family protein [Rhodocyclaceae bacterium]
MSQVPAVSPIYNSRLFVFDTFEARSLAMIQKLKITATRFLLLPIFCAMCLSAGEAAASSESVRPFVTGSLAQIVGERQGKPFVLALWSTSCTHCPAELKALGQLKRNHPNLDVVLVAADSPGEAPLAAEMVRAYGLKASPQWIFADAMPERLRFEIDRRWHGELPRTYLYDRQHAVQAFSGLVPPDLLMQWIKVNVR